MVPDVFILAPFREFKQQQKSPCRPTCLVLRCPPYCNLACLSLQVMQINLLSSGICLTLRIYMVVFAVAYCISLAWVAFVRS